MKKYIAIVCVLFAALSVFVLGTPVAYAAAEYVTEQPMTFVMGDAERTGLYTGPLENGLAHGQGQFSWENSEGYSFVYEGDFENGVIQGQGERVSRAPDSDSEWRWVGPFENGVPHGRIQFYENGVLDHEGEYANGERVFDIWLIVWAFFIFIIVAAGASIAAAVITDRVRHLRIVKKAKEAGLLPQYMDVWQIPAASIAELSNALEAIARGKQGASIVVGQRPFVAHIIRNVMFIAFDIVLIAAFFAVDFQWLPGIPLICWILVGSAIVSIIRSIIELRKSNIIVEDDCVTINGSAITYDNIADVFLLGILKASGKIIITTNDGRHYKLTLINAQAVKDAIMARKGNGGQPVCTKCGNPLQNDASFCDRCGQSRQINTRDTTGNESIKGHRFIVRGDTYKARNTVYATLENHGFTLTHMDDWSADAEKERHAKLRVTCQTTPAGLVITLTQETAAASGGLPGMDQSANLYSDVYNTIGLTFQNAGILISGSNL
ncbi:MAG TPA: hypothetical protein DEB31_07885 [Clostridiales bacterium]|nr:hypothetical protein [Clostridiales bacterium]